MSYTRGRLMEVCKSLRNAAYWLEIADERGCEEFNISACANNLAHAVQLLGYSLVPITTPQQEHDVLLAARVAEDGPPPVTSGPGYDGRDASIGMREQDIEGAAV